MLCCAILTGRAVVTKRFTSLIWLGLFFFFLHFIFLFRNATKLILKHCIQHGSH